ncbi:hypothetical protein EES45_08505 [Streptomyces sp. ADI97-07]|nr:hypothetical protein EES45_08505 [Streptomyces sp. ADI97-07]
MTHGGASLFLRSGLGCAERPGERDPARRVVVAGSGDADRVVTGPPVAGGATAGSSIVVTSSAVGRVTAGSSDRAGSPTGVAVPDCPGATRRRSSMSIVTTRPWAGSVALRTRLAALVSAKSRTPTRGPSWPAWKVSRTWASLAASALATASARSWPLASERLPCPVRVTAGIGRPWARFHSPARASERARPSIVASASTGVPRLPSSKRTVRWCMRGVWPCSTTVVSGLATAGEASESRAALASCADSPGRLLYARKNHWSLLSSTGAAAVISSLARERASATSRSASACSGRSSSK